MTTRRFRMLAVISGVSLGCALAPEMAHAQRTAVAAVPRVAPAHVRPVSRVVVSQARPAPKSAARVRSRVAPGDFLFGGESGLSVQQLLDPVPPPGFNYEDLAAFDRDIAIKAVIDPATQWRLAVAERLLRDSRFAGSGFYILDGGGAYAVPVDTSVESNEPPQPAPQPQVILVQAPPAASQEAPVVAAGPESSAPLQDVGQFVLVLRNGTQIQAVACTRANDRIIYITAEGLRRTLAFADLDSESTLRVNEERGTLLRL